MVWLQQTQTARYKGYGMRQIGKAGQVAYLCCSNLDIINVLLTIIIKWTRWVLQSIHPLLVRIYIKLTNLLEYTYTRLR